MVTKLPVVRLPDDLIARCQRYGQDMVYGYANGFSSASRAVSSHGAEADPDLQAKAKMAEAAACLFFGLDPLRELDWTWDADAGHDFAYGGVRIDVKGIHRGKRYLIWPVNKRWFYDDKRFDVFVLVEEDVPHFWISGFISKPDFKHQKSIAGDGHQLTKGTWYLDRRRLQPIEVLISDCADADVLSAVPPPDWL